MLIYAILWCLFGLLCFAVHLNFLGVLMLIIGIPALIYNIYLFVTEPSDKEYNEKIKKTQMEETEALKAKGFVKTKELDKSFSIDEVHKKFCFFNKYVYNYSDLVEFEYVENGETIKTEQQGATGRAIIGGVLFGAVGAVVGAATASTKSTTTIDGIYINIYLSNGSKSEIFICGKTEKGSVQYNKARREAEDILAVLYSIKNSNKR